MEYYILTLVIAAGLGLIPANIAQRKGYSFGLWWLYGWMLFIVAIIHVNMIPDKNAPQPPAGPYSSAPYSSPSNQVLSAADELKKYKELLDSGIINEKEFSKKKEQLLKLM